MLINRIQFTCGVVLLSIALFPVNSLARSARAMFMGATGDMPNEATLLIGNEVVTIKLPRRYFSPEVDLPSGAVNAFVLEKPPLPDEEINPKTPVIQFPEGSGRSLLLFIPDPTNDVFPARVIVLDVSATKFPKGHTLIFNFSDANVAGMFGNEKVQVGAGQRAVLKPPLDDVGSYSVRIACKLPSSDEWVKICSSKWRHNPNARQLMFISPSGRKYPRVWTVLDRSTSKLSE